MGIKIVEKATEKTDEKNGLKCYQKRILKDLNFPLIGGYGIPAPKTGIVKFESLVHTPMPTRHQKSNSSQRLFTRGDTQSTNFSIMKQWIFKFLFLLNIFCFFFLTQQIRTKCNQNEAVENFSKSSGIKHPILNQFPKSREIFATWNFANKTKKSKVLNNRPFFSNFTKFGDF